MTDGSTWPVLTAGLLGDEARNLLDTISGGVILQDRRGFAVYANTAALELIGLSFAEISGAAPIREGWRATNEQGADLGLEEQPAAAALRTGESQQLLVGITLPDGDRRWLWNEAVPVAGPSGQPELVISSFIDLTPRRLAEERLELAIDAGRIGIWDWNITTNELAWSDHVERLFGLERDEFEGTFEAFLMRVHPDDRQPVREAISTAVQHGGRYETELRVVWPDGSVHWLLAVGEVYRNPYGAPARMVGVTRDITARREAELERETNELRLSFLIEATTVLSSSFEYEATLGQLAHLVVPLLADWCAIDLLGENRSFRRVASVGAEPAPGDVPTLMSVPARVRGGASELRSDLTGGELGDLRSLVVAPLPSRGQVVGALWMGTSASGRRYDVDDQMLVEELARRAALAVENARLYEDRRRVADTLQASLLPPTLPSVPGIDIGAAYRASGEGNDIGGDFYDVFEIGGGAWAAVIGDVCGKGTGAAAVTGLARHTLRAVALRGETPSRVLSLLNDVILGEESDDRFLTAVFCRVVPTEAGARVVLARGGHLPPLLRRAAGTVRALGHPGLLIGSLPDITLADDTVDLAPGDVIVLCTDGVTEARSADGIFGPERLRDLVAGCEGLDAQAVADRVKDAALDFQPGLPRDDVAVLVLRVTGGMQRCTRRGGWWVEASMTTIATRIERATTQSGSITFVGASDGADRVEWARIHDDARGVAAALQARGVGPGDHVALLGPTTRPLVTAIQATWLAGATVVVLPLPMRLGSIEEFVAQTRARATAADASLLVLDDDLAPFIEPRRSDAPMALLSELAPGPGRPTAHNFERPPDDPDALAILQFTSGSTAEPKGVMLPHDRVLANLDAAAAGVALDPANDVLLSWLPLYHDMGLIGLLTLPMITGADLVLAGAQDFMASPARWMEWMSAFGATATAGPNFAYALAARALGRLDGLDLSRWRIGLNGAEPIDPANVEDFCAAGERHGLDPRAVFCAFGMAEVTIAGTFPAPGAGMAVDCIDRRVLETDRYAAPRGAGEVGTRRLARLGKPVEGLQLRIVEPETGRGMREREVGELEIKGTSVTPGYYRRPTETARAFRDGWLRTGDLAYLVDGELVVCGRIKDVIIVGGRNVFPEDVERAVASVAGVRAGNVIAFGVEGRRGRESVVVVAETKADEIGPMRDEVSRRVRQAVGVPLRDVVLVSPGTLPKTSSGKLQRALCRTRYLGEELQPI